MLSGNGSSEEVMALIHAKCQHFSPYTIPFRPGFIYSDDEQKQLQSVKCVYNDSHSFSFFCN